MKQQMRLEICYKTLQKGKIFIIKSTYIQRKDIYKSSWRSLNAQTINPIEHALIEKDQEKCI